MGDNLAVKSAACYLIRADLWPSLHYIKPPI